MLVYDNVCVDECPSGFATAGMVPNEDGTACRPWQLSDMGWFPFPFLIAAAIFTIICLFGIMKREAYLYKGKATWRSPQNTLTCIIVCLAPLQFIATIFQWILCLIYPLNTFAILSCVVTLFAIILNIVFQCWFARSFNQKKFPADIERRVRLDKMTREEARKHMVDKDEKFITHKNLFGCSSKTIFALTAILNFKFNKLYYSFFYN
jgi:small-conductance mechanosensitive channel